jgi:hypothetical protein
MLLSTDNDGMTPAHTASFYRHPEVPRRSYLTQSVYQVVLRRSIPTQTRQLILYYN